VPKKILPFTPGGVVACNIFVMCMDVIWSDIEIQCSDGVCFPSHKCILSVRVPELRKKLGESKLIVKYESKVLSIVLEFIYGEILPRQYNKKIANNVVKIAEEWKLKELKKYAIAKPHQKKVLTIASTFLRDMQKMIENAEEHFPDVEIVLNDGKAVKAHKCVLAARSDFFKILLSSSQKKSIRLFFSFFF